ncbi:MAG: radical SAM protein [Chloroflexi bacterium]|nr:radical SAM protein [Chloroflexota bacterium]
MTELLFGQSYYLRFDPKLYEAMQPYPPLGTLYAASRMRQHGVSVALFDAMLADSPEEWGEALDRHKPRFAILFEDNFNYLSKMSLLRMREAAFVMIDAAKARGCIVICCGSDETDHADAYLKRGADVVLIGEGDAALPEVIDFYNGRGRPLDQIAGIAYTAPDGTTAHTLPRPVIADLDALPFPAWDLVDRDRYRSIWRERHGYYSMNLVTTRGCPFHCNWCAKPIWGQRYNVRSPQNVVEEMAWLKEHFDPDHIWFMDDIMGIRDRWIEEFADLLDARGLRIPFKCLNRVDLLLRGRTIPALARAGAKTVWVGAESGSQKILDAMEKGTTVEQIYAAARQLHDHGVKVGFFLQFGYPGETREDIEKTLQMVRDLMPDDIGISVSYPLPGTRFYESVKHELSERVNWVDSEDLAMLYRGPFRTEFYRQLHTVVHKEYRSRKTARALRTLARQPSALRPAHLRQTAAMIYHWATLPAARARLDALAQLPHDSARTPNVTLA